jgi:hypothetical protein
MAPTSETVTLNLRITLRRKHGQWRAYTAVVEPFLDGWPEDPAEFGQAVHRARLSVGVDIVEFAEVVGVTAATIRNVETNRQPPKPEHRTWILLALAKLGVTAPGERTSTPQPTKDPK